MENLELQIEDQFQSFKTELAKFKKGNKSAGTRARTALQSIRGLAFDLRKEISAQKNS